MAKSATFGVIHLVIGFSVGYALTGSVAIAGAVALIEPAANTVAHYFFDRWWTARERRRAERPVAAAPSAPDLVVAGASP